MWPLRVAGQGKKEALQLVIPMQGCVYLGREQSLHNPNRPLKTASSEQTLNLRSCLGFNLFLNRSRIPDLDVQPPPFSTCVSEIITKYIGVPGWKVGRTWRLTGSGEGRETGPSARALRAVKPAVELVPERHYDVVDTILETPSTLTGPSPTDL
ncbi:hypothetical protein CLCR_06334 [Cladophialophora carrionii]|uniref:Uncharacterized protein n=1 Tax=Cladophialophora carrionii TaxID=86049 RepID=A0A1C1C9I1_9EURO|nr:hypothetical protein CLCR_06334 [Cladophialophora carrionii]